VITVADLRAAAERVRDAMEREADALNAADGALGDGDLGVTLRRGGRAMAERAGEMPEDDLGRALMVAAQAVTKASSSSYGTLMATGLMAAAKAVKGRGGVELAELAGLVAAARDAMQARGKAELGGKTVLDSLDAIARALDGAGDEAPERAVAAAREAQAAFRDRPATVGRARIFGARSVGLDDPGMLAMTKLVEAVTGRGPPR
jgi:dihydroxyacetone kinase-like protein